MIMAGIYKPGNYINLVVGARCAIMTVPYMFLLFDAMFVFFDTKIS
jgi:hypothetical protein